MKTAGKLCALLLFLCLLFTALPLFAFADDSEHLSGGEFGDGFSYVYNSENKLLMVRGEGAMPAFTEQDPAPWGEFTDTLTRVILGEGISSVPAGAFADCIKLRSAVFPTTIEEIEEGTFPRSVKFTTASTVGDSSALRRLLKAAKVYPNVTRISEKSLEEELATLSSPAFDLDEQHPAEDKQTLAQIHEEMAQRWQDWLAAQTP